MSAARTDAQRTDRVASIPARDFFAVGRIVGVHGLKGELKVESHTDFAQRFAPGSLLLLGEEREQVTVRASRPHKAHTLVTLAEVQSRSEAEELRGAWLYIVAAEAAALEENAYWVHDLLGMDVVTDDGTRMGKIGDVLFTGANEVYVVRDAEGREVLLPATDEVVRTVDLAHRLMTVHLIPGILK